MTDYRKIKIAPTYADALEMVREISAGYKVRLRLFSFFESLISIRGGCGCAIAVFVISLAYMLGPLLLILIPLELLLILTARRVKLEEGWLKIYLCFIRVRKINTVDICWVGTKWTVGSMKRYYFCTGGRRVSVSGVYSERDKKNEELVYHALFELAKKKQEAEADGFITGNTPVPVPLSEGATHRMFFWLVLAMFIVFPASVLLIISGLDDLGKAIVDIYTRRVIYLLVVVFAPALIGILAIAYGWFRFFKVYGIRRQNFRPEGFFSSEGDFIPYEKMRITLFRGYGKLEEPHPGVLEVQYRDRPIIYLGPQRHNFFVLPYVLKAWAGKTFSVLHEDHAPLGVASIPYHDTINLFLPFLSGPPRRIMPDWKKPDRVIESEQPQKKTEGEPDSIDDIPDSELLLDEPEDQ